MIPQPKRDEVWVVIGGEGRIIVDGMEQLIKVGDVVTMAAGCKHTVIAQTELQMTIFFSPIAKTGISSSLIT